MKKFISKSKIDQIIKEEYQKIREVQEGGSTAQTLTDLILHLQELLDQWEEKEYPWLRLE